VASSGPIETKVKASTTAGAFAALVLWALDTYVFKDGAVPEVVSAAVDVLVVSIVTFAAGYLAKHTPRPDAPSTPPVGGSRTIG
jgi:hypothetical protein